MTVLAAYYDTNYVGFLSDVEVAAVPPRESFKIQYSEDLSIVYAIVGDELAINVINTLLMWNSIAAIQSKIQLDQLPFIQEVTRAMTHLARTSKSYAPQYRDTNIYIFSGQRLFMWRVSAIASQKLFSPLQGLPMTLPPNQIHFDWFGNRSSKPTTVPSSESDLRSILETQILNEDQVWRSNLAPNSQVPPLLNGRFTTVISSTNGNKLISHPYVSFFDMISRFV